MAVFKRKAKPKKKGELQDAGVSEPEIAQNEVIVPDPPPTPPKEEPKATPKKESEAKDDAPKEEPPKEKPRILPKVNLSVYLATCGRKPDQTAGFRRWMKGRKVRRQTIPEWNQMWETFQNRPVRGG